MDFSFDFLEGTVEKEQLRQIVGFYADVDSRLSKFQRAYGISCSEGCGECCYRFTPDVTPSESLLIAAYILFDLKNPDLLKNTSQSDEEHKRCPLCKDGSHHCMVYPARPLLCRLFGSAASRRKDGKPCFRRCHFLKDRRLMPEELDGKDFKGNVTTMEEYGLELNELPCNSSVAHPLVEQVEKDIERLLLLWEIKNMPPAM